MPDQTTVKNKVNIPDGVKVEVKKPADVSYTDLGQITPGVTLTYNYDVTQTETGNAGIGDPYAKNQTIAGTITLENIDYAGIEILGADLLEKVVTAASPTSSIPTQTIAAGWSATDKIEMVMQTSSSDDTLLRTTAKPTLTSVILDPTGVNETLVEDNDYIVQADPSVPSGWSVNLIPANMVEASPTVLPVVITYGTNTPQASTTLHAGETTKTMNPFLMRFTHTDDTPTVTFQMDLYRVIMDSGGISFNRKGANEGGYDDMAMAFTATIDTTLTEGRQLFSVTQV